MKIRKQRTWLEIFYQSAFVTRLRDLTLRSKLLLVLLFVSLVPMSISAYIYFNYSVSVMANELGANSVLITRQVQGKLDAFFDQLQSLSNMISYNPDVQHLLTLKEDQIDGRTLVLMKDEVERQLVTMSLYRQLFFNSNKPYSEVKGVFLYTDERIFVYNILEKVIVENYPFQDQAWFQQIAKQDNAILIPEHLADYTDHKPVITFARRLKSSIDFSERGTLFVDISPSLFDRFVSDIQIGKTGFVFLMDAEGNPVYHSERFPSNLIDSEVMSTIHPSPDGSFTRTYKGERTLVSYSTSERTGWTVVAVVPWSEIGQELRNSIRLTLIVLLLVAVTIMVVVSGLFSRVLTSPMLKLQKAMRVAESGNFAVRIDMARRDEFGRLGDYFNNMLRELDVLQQEILQTRMREFQLQLHRKDSELVALRAQINPHFLYNTLNTMSCMGEVHNVKEITMLSTALGQMFQYSSTGEHYSTLEEELKHVNSYLTIMRMRYGERYQINEVVPEHLLGVRVIKMMLQPLVENAYQHGLETSDSGRIDILVVDKGNEIVIAVLDDGEGMSDSRLAEMKELLMSGSASDTMAKEHIGLYNVQKRLQLHYEGKAYLDIASERGRGTAVSIHIPYVTDETSVGGGGHVPTADS